MAKTRTVIRRPIHFVEIIHPTADEPGFYACVGENNVTEIIQNLEHGCPWLHVYKGDDLAYKYNLRYVTIIGYEDPNGGIDAVSKER